MTNIHPTSLISPGALVGAGVCIGPFCEIEEGVVLGDRCTLAGRVTIRRGTVLGADNEISEGVVLGGKPQHLRAGDQTGGLRIGDGNRIRENVTIHRALQVGAETVVGDHNLIMVNSHIAHDCRLGSHIVLVNNVLLAGHVLVGDRAYLGGAAAVHQFCRIGSYAMVGGQSHVSQDVPPYIMLDGKSTRVVGLNLVGLRRAGFADPDIRQLKEAYRVIYRSGLTWAETIRELTARFTSGPAAQFPAFFAEGKRGFVQERRTPKAATVSFPPTTDSASDAEPVRISQRKAS